MCYLSETDLICLVWSPLVACVCMQMRTSIFPFLHTCFLLTHWTKEICYIDSERVVITLDQERKTPSSFGLWVGLGLDGRFGKQEGPEREAAGTLSPVKFHEWVKETLFEAGEAEGG